MAGRMLRRFTKELMRKRLAFVKNSPYNAAVVGYKIDNFASLPPRYCALRLFHQIRNESTQYEALKRVLKRDPHLNPASNQEIEKTLEFPRFGRTDLPIDSTGSEVPERFERASLTLESSHSQKSTGVETPPPPRSVEDILSKPVNPPITCTINNLKFRESYARLRTDFPEHGRRSVHSLPGNWCFLPDHPLHSETQGPKLSKSIETLKAPVNCASIPLEQTTHLLEEILNEPKETGQPNTEETSAPEKYQLSEVHVDAETLNELGPLPSRKISSQSVGVASEPGLQTEEKSTHKETPENSKNDNTETGVFDTQSSKVPESQNEEHALFVSNSGNALHTSHSNESINHRFELVNNTKESCSQQREIDDTEESLKECSDTEAPGNVLENSLRSEPSNMSVSDSYEFVDAKEDYSLRSETKDVESKPIGQ